MSKKELVKFVREGTGLKEIIDDADVAEGLSDDLADLIQSFIFIRHLACLKDDMRHLYHMMLENAGFMRTK